MALVSKKMACAYEIRDNCMKNKNVAAVRYYEMGCADEGLKGSD